MQNYEQIKLLGEGGYGKALLVRRKSDKSLFVVKQIKLSSLNDKEKKEAMREVEVLAALRHPNIVAYVESFQERGYLNIVMEYADGGDLSQKIQKRGSRLFTEQEILNDFVQIALAIKYIHDRKILHRDLKGQNIFLTKDGKVKLGDFGIAKVLDHTFELCKTQIGTPYYLSPEMCEGKNYNAKTDIWSLGCILYEQCTLKHAFEGNNINRLLMNILRGRFAPISSNYSPDLRNLVNLMLTKDPKARPSINQILMLPIIKGQLSKFLSQVEIDKELNHTVLHGRNPLAGPTAEFHELPPIPEPSDDDKFNDRKSDVPISKPSQQGKRSPQTPAKQQPLQKPAPKPDPIRYPSNVDPRYAKKQQKNANPNVDPRYARLNGIKQQQQQQSPLMNVNQNLQRSPNSPGRGLSPRLVNQNQNQNQNFLLKKAEEEKQKREEAERIIQQRKEEEKRKREEAEKLIQQRKEEEKRKREELERAIQQKKEDEKRRMEELRRQRAEEEEKKRKAFEERRRKEAEEERLKQGRAREEAIRRKREVEAAAVRKYEEQRRAEQEKERRRLEDQMRADKALEQQKMEYARQQQERERQQERARQIAQEKWLQAKEKAKEEKRLKNEQMRKQGELNRLRAERERAEQEERQRQQRLDQEEMLRVNDEMVRRKREKELLERQRMREEEEKFRREQEELDRREEERRRQREREDELRRKRNEEAARQRDLEMKRNSKSPKRAQKKAIVQNSPRNRPKPPKPPKVPEQIQKMLDTEYASGADSFVQQRISDTPDWARKRLVQEAEELQEMLAQKRLQQSPPTFDEAPPDGGVSVEDVIKFQRQNADAIARARRNIDAPKRSNENERRFLAPEVIAEARRNYENDVMRASIQEALALQPGSEQPEEEPQPREHVLYTGEGRCELPVAHDMQSLMSRAEKIRALLIRRMGESRLLQVRRELLNDGESPMMAQLAPDLQMMMAQLMNLDDMIESGSYY